MGMGLGKRGTSRRGGRGQTAIAAEINVTPLVDVMLVLLVIFMVTSPMLVSGVNVDLPATDAAPVSHQEEPLAITVKSDGTVYLQDEEIALDELVERLRAIADTRKDKDLRIMVRGDKRIDYGTVMSVIGTINAAGYNKVALLTDIKSKP